MTSWLDDKQADDAAPAQAHNPPMPEAPIPPDLSAAAYSISVRELCEFTAKTGDLDLRFTPAPTSAEGIAGHAIVTGRRGRSYRRELALEARYKTLHLRGRADGYDAGARLLEEIKTYRGDFARIPDNHRALHWAQLKLYGALLCMDQDLADVRLQLVYFNVDEEDETTLTESHDAASLRAFFEQQCEAFIAWADAQLAHRRARDIALTDAAFPHPDFHAGQRRLAEAVFRAARDGHDLLVQAPTGIGKSIGTVFPALKAVAHRHLDKLFFLTAKTPGRKLALDAIAALKTKNEALPLRALELVARDKACEHPDKACHGESCPLAQGFYDRLPAARAAAIALDRTLDQATVREAALQHGVCPYYLSQDLTRWADVIVGDYNYYFDQSALLHGLTQINDWRVGVLVDEAHNLVDRGRAMYSAELDQRQLAALKKIAPPAVRKALDRVARAWNRTTRDQEQAYQSYPLPPGAFIETLRKASADIGEYFTANAATVFPELQRFYFDALNFIGLADEFGDHSIFDIQLLPSRSARTTTTPLSVLCLRNLVPAPFLARRLTSAATTVAFSATLNPPGYYRDLLGFSDQNTRWVDVPSPFTAEQLHVEIAEHISTRYTHRTRSLKPIAELMARQYRDAPGNYLAFFSSYDYLQQAADTFAKAHPDIPMWTQNPRMTEADRSAFLERFTEDGQGIGFAVLGGAFAEGIDLPGKRLIGAFVATLGLPQFNPVNEAMRQRLEQLFGEGAGYDYAYLYPGIQKVVQAAGRVIRGKGDRGVVYLIDDRFASAQVRQLLPMWWQA
jgi:DNA excision repair protein ERCC-2